MNIHLTFSLIRIAWFTWLLFWIWSARGAKRTERSESTASRLSYLLLVFVGLIIMSFSRFGPQIIPNSEPLNLLGAVLTWAGVLFSIWARAILGGNWSGAVTLKQNHELISTGPYRLVRNPIYAGMLLAGIGLVVALGSLEALAGYLVVFAALIWKSRMEQRMLATRFGDAYTGYRKRTKLLIPYVF